MVGPVRSPLGLFGALLAAAVAAACSQGEQGVVQGRSGEPAITLSEGECRGSPCPVYDITLKPDGAYTLNSEKFVKGEGVTEGDLGKDAWKSATEVLEAADFWTLKAQQTRDTMPTCVADAPTAMITWRKDDGKEKTLTYDAGCHVDKMVQLIADLRRALKFEELVWTDEKFGPNGERR
jgi:hypothetical protein